MGYEGMRNYPLCDECKKVIKNKNDLVVFGGNWTMIFLKKVHRNCYSSSKPYNPPWIISQFKVPVNNRMATYLSITLFFINGLSFIFQFLFPFFQNCLFSRS